MFRATCLSVLAAFTIACSGPTPASAPMASTSSPAEQRRASIEKRLPGATVQVRPNSQYANSIAMGAPLAVQGGGTAAAAATTFLDANRDLIAPAPSRFIRASTQPDPLDTSGTIVTFRQVVDTPTPSGLRVIPVFGGEVVVRIGGDVRPGINVVSTVAEALPADLTPTVGAEEARQTAVSEYTRTEHTPPPAISAATLTIFSPARLGLPGESVLSWQVDVGSLRVFVNARSGAIAHQYWNAPSIARQVFECQSKANCPLAFLDEVEKRTPTAAESKNLRDSTSQTVSYFQKMFRQDGYEGPAVATIPIRVYSRAWRNQAGYDVATRELHFPAGWVALDVVAHEFTHGILFVRKQMPYTGQPGNVQEFFADLFAALIDPANPWEIGETVSSGIWPTPLRDLRTPKKYGFDRFTSHDFKTNGGQPEHMNEFVLPTHAICASLPKADGGCVHFNGSILSLASLRAVQGLAGHAGMGTDRFAQVAYASMVGVPQSPDLSMTATQLVDACDAFFKASQHAIRPSDCVVLRAALQSVGLP